MSSQGCLYSGCLRRFWSRWWPMKPMDRPSTKRPLRQPFAMSSSASSTVIAPQCRSRSTKQTATQPSTLRMRFERFAVVMASTSSAKSKVGVLGKCALAYSLMRTTRWSGFSSDLMRWPMPMMSLLFFLHSETNAAAETPRSTASVIIVAAPSKAPPKRGPMVNNPDASELTRSLPARVATMALCAPATAGPWSAVTMRTISTNFVAYGGSRLRNQSRQSTPPTPRSSLKTSEMGVPAYRSSSPRSSEIVEMKLAGLRTMPRRLAQV
mmetsp:Transcript_19396/g.59734  ORF Transcript_19396/g.59734 Transcript_19396/m.59734 type:complete len:267 (+) Transcript_19396:66-866(+)